MADAAKLTHYLTELAKDVDGYLQSGSASIIWSLFEVQDELGITGNIAEIGVYHGRLFVFLCHAAHDGETAFAIDVFDQAPHIQGIETEEDRLRFSDANLKRNLAAAGQRAHLGRRHFLAVGGDDAGFIIADAGGANVRLFSVDGDHSGAGVRHDLGLAEAALAAGGVILVDDLFNTLCPSLTEGIIDYFGKGTPDLEPVAIIASNGPLITGGAKLLLARPQFAHVYKAYLRLLNRDNFRHAVPFLGFENVLVFDFQGAPVRHPLDDAVRAAVARFMNEDADA
jgi:hypothetical protein